MADEELKEESEAAGSAAAAVPLVASPEPVAAVDAGPRNKAEFLSVAASAVGHVLVGLLFVVSLPSLKSPEVIPIRLIPPDQPPPKPQPATRKPAEAPKDTSAAEKPPPAVAKQPSPPAKSGAPQQQQAAPGGDAGAPGMAEFPPSSTTPAELIAEVGAQAKRCWTIPDGWSDPRQVSVTLRFQLEPDGRLAGDPAVVEFPATSVGAAAAKAAMEAVKQCGPYRLPSVRYDEWKDIQLKLAP